MWWLWLVLAAFLLGVFFVCFLFLSEIWRITLSEGIPAVSSTWAVVDRVIVERVLPREGLILDLGCGTGWTLRRLWRSGLRGPFVGYENAFVPWFAGRVWNCVTMCPVNVQRADLFTAPFEQARGVYLFLLPDFLKRLGPELKHRLNPGAVVVSAEFPIPDWTPWKTFEARGVTKPHAKVFVYRV
jgi:hypothetical protein